MKTLVFDIETIALPESELPPFDETTVALGNCKDPEKVKAKVESARAEWLAGAALSPMTGAVAMVGLKWLGQEPTILTGEEIVCIGKTISTLSEAIWAGNRIVGFNCCSFDIPFLIKRVWKHGMSIPIGLREGRYWSRSIVDLRDEWLMGDRAPAKGTSSLEAVARFLGLPPKLGSGADFGKLSLEDRIAYLRRDLEVTEALWLRIGKSTDSTEDEPIGITP